MQTSVGMLSDYLVRAVSGRSWLETFGAQIKIGWRTSHKGLNIGGGEHEGERGGLG